MLPEKEYSELPIHSRDSSGGSTYYRSTRGLVLRHARFIKLGSWALLGLGALGWLWLLAASSEEQAPGDASSVVRPADAQSSSGSSSSKPLQLPSWLTPLRWDSSPTTSDLDAPSISYQPFSAAANVPLPPEATLQERLEAWRTAPTSEPATFVKWNQETCWDVQSNQINDQLHKSSELWASMNQSEILGRRFAMIAELERHASEGAFEVGGGRSLVGEGRGMVMTAGGADNLKRVALHLHIMRNYHNNTLPCEIFHFPSEAPELLDPIHAHLAGLNAKLVPVAMGEKVEGRKSFHIKGQAMIESSFREVLYLDSDNLPAMDPEYIFDSPGYTRLGAFFYPDYWKTVPHNQIWHILGIQCRDEWEMEAGQLFIDKAQHLDALLLARYMMIDWEFWFNFSDGDKDTFRYAMLALRKRWAVPGRYMAAAGLPRNTLSGWCGHTMLQHDHKGEPIFVHYNLLKQIPSGVYKGFTWGRHKMLPDFPPDPDEGFDDSGLPSKDDVDADMLADADYMGRALSPAPEVVRRRAALERGMRMRFHGGGNSAFCTDVYHEDIRPITDDGEEAEPAVNVKWDDPIVEVKWDSFEHLKDFEENWYKEGKNAKGTGYQIS